MKKLSFLIIFLFLSTNSHSKHETFSYDFFSWDKYEVKGSKNYLKFNSELTKDETVLKEIQNSEKTGLISYLLFKDNKIVVDESNLPENIKKNNNLLLSNSVGKSLVSYVTGHAICEGYIDNVDVTLEDWSILDNTLYQGQKLIDILNMSAGDQGITGQKYFSSDTELKGTKWNVNTIPVKDLMSTTILQNTKKSSKTYNYNALATNIVMNYTIFKTGDDWQKLLNKIFNETVKVENDVYFLRVSPRYSNTDGGGRYSFYATRYDYLRIAKTIMDDWNNDTCVGKYLKTIYERRISKNRDTYNPTYVYSYSAKYGGQFHFDIIGLGKRKILGMDGLGGQQILIDFEKEKIIVIHSTTPHYNWMKIAYLVLKEN
jgi:CubicO group peptidase (beta-lactamase class C family)